MYSSTQDLPAPVRKQIPSQYWKVYLSAFNNAWRDFKPDQTQGKSREEFAHEIAFSAATWPGQYPSD